MRIISVGGDFLYCVWFHIFLCRIQDLPLIRCIKGDPFGLIRNTGIRSGVREHVGALSGIIPHWRDKAASSSYEFVLRRYIATSRGVMVTYPATVVRDSYEPDLQPWFV